MPSAVFIAAWVLSHAGITENSTHWVSTQNAEIASERLVNGQPPTAGGETDANDDIASRLELAAESIRAQAPVRQPASTITGARVQGKTLVTTMTIIVAMDRSLLLGVRRTLVDLICANPDLTPLIRAGATFTYEITDSASQIHSISVDRCSAD